MEKLRTLDILSPSISLSVDGGDGVKTTMGAFLSIMWFAAFIITATIMGMSYFRTDQPTVTKDVTTSEIYPKINCLDDGHIPVLFATLEEIYTLTYEESLRYITYSYQKTRWISKDQGLTFETEVVDMPLVPCKELPPEKLSKVAILSSDSGFLGKAVNDFGICVNYDEKESYVQGKSSDDVMDVLTLAILPCSLPSGCAPAAEVERFSMQFGIGGFNINLSNYLSPASKILTADDFYAMNIYSGLKVTRKLSRTQVRDQKNNFFFSKDEVRTEYSEVERETSAIIARDPAQITCTDSEIQSGACKPYYSFMYISGGTLTTTSRTYKGLTETLGEIGGMKELIFIVFYYLYYWFNLQAQKCQLLLKIYGIEKERKQSTGLCGCKPRRKRDRHVVPDMNSPSKTALSSSATSTPHSPTAGRTGQQAKDSGRGEKQEGGVVVSQADFEYAYELMHSRLDIVTIVKEINTLKFLTHFLLSESQVALIPFVSLSHDLHDRDQRVKPDTQARKTCCGKNRDDVGVPKNKTPSMSEARCAIASIRENLEISSGKQIEVKTVGGGINSGQDRLLQAQYSGSLLSRLHKEMNKYSLNTISKTAAISNTLLANPDHHPDDLHSFATLMQKLDYHSVIPGSSNHSNQVLHAPSLSLKPNQQQGGEWPDKQ